MGWTVYNSDGQILQGSSTLADDAVTTAKILDDAVTYAKMQNLATADRVLGSTSTGVIGEVQIVPDMLATDAVTNVKVATGIDAVKLADGTVTNAELQYINTLSSNAQTQLAAKHATIDSSARLDASLIGANGNVSNTEYGYLSGVTSDIQTQLSAGGGGAVSREGGNTSEATSTSTSVADLLVMSSLSLTAAELFHFSYLPRKTSGATNFVAHGLKFNSTSNVLANEGGTLELWYGEHATNNAASGFCYWVVGPRVTNYTLGMGGWNQAYQDQGEFEKLRGGGAGIQRWNVRMVIETFTSLTITTYSPTSAITSGADEGHVWAWAVS